MSAFILSRTKSKLLLSSRSPSEQALNFKNNTRRFGDLPTFFLFLMIMLRLTWLALESTRLGELEQFQLISYYDNANIGRGFMEHQSEFINMLNGAPSCKRASSPDKPIFNIKKHQIVNKQTNKHLESYFIAANQSGTESNNLSSIKFKGICVDISV